MLNFIKKSEKPTEKDIINTRNNGTDSTSSVKKSSDNGNNRSNSNCSKNNPEKIGQSYDLWLQLYKPITSKDLAMHIGRVKSIREWILKATAAHKESQNTPGFRPYVLALLGSSGVCKSTAVEILSKELKLQLKVWTEDSWDAGAVSSFNKMNLSRNNSYNKYSNEDHLFNSNNSKTEELEEYVMRSAYPSISLSIKANSGKPSEVIKNRVQIGLKNNSSQNHGSQNNSQNPQNPQNHSENHGFKKRKVINTNNDDDDDVIIIDDSDSGTEGGFKNSNSLMTRSAVKLQPSKRITEITEEPRLVMIEDPPHLLQRLYNTDRGDNDVSTTNSRNEDIMGALMGTFRDPLILIISDVCGKDDAHFSASRCFSQEIKQQINFDSIYCQAITEKNIIKVLENIVVKEKIPKNRVPPGVLEHIAGSSMGDLRHAIVQMQLVISSNTYNKDKRN
eukprot:CAMPEP_0119053398 /NCGR_PEP_ID=MMETSP1177-20130426/74407_1 /TAXON_ID=2985 /ORGANISM="Ochromonas sp, Strain CCMP1899" /LENGTH=447 /DNA_ID=CAMNT_0007033345 /DNA_START=76 /DNA_END=1419 /DNA_ORIENTATION=+